MFSDPAFSASTTGIDLGALAVVDVETSGLSRHSDRVVSVAVTTVARDGSLTEEFHSLVDPGCDPGPVHVHGLTRDVLRGAPQFDDVRDRLAGLLEGRVMVAHNAAFDYGFLANEFDRCGAELPVRRRLCTLALARRVAVPTADCRLGTLAAHYGVRQRRAHSAIDDVRVLTGVLGGLLSDASSLGVWPPLLTCPPRDDYQSRHGLPPGRTTPKVACQFRYPGRWTPGAPLVQGMKVAITGTTLRDRNELIEFIEAAGLEVTGSVSRRTSLLVTNEPGSDTQKIARAREYGTAVIDENTMLSMMTTVAAGIGKQAHKPADARRPVSSNSVAAPRGGGPLQGHRILVLGGRHDLAAQYRAKIGELGGSPAINMSATVTDVLALPGSEGTARLMKARERGLPILQDLESVGSPVPVADASTTQELTRGQVIDLPVSESGRAWTVRASWLQNESWAVDVVAFLVDDDERVGEDEDFVFYNWPNGVGARLTTDGPDEQSIVVDLEQLSDTCTKVVVCAAVDGDGAVFGDVGAIELELSAGEQGGALARSTLDAATTERSLVLAEIYLRRDTWRIRSVGQGFEFDLAGLADRYGVVVDG